MLMRCIHTMNMSGYDRSSVSMYVHVYLYVSALFEQTKMAKAKV